jgi:uncharacterized protein (DUF433 family)
MTTTQHTNIYPSSIYVDKETMSGTPVFAGTRVSIKSLFDWLETESLEEFLENFPSVKREQTLEVLHYAENLVLNPIQ